MSKDNSSANTDTAGDAGVSDDVLALAAARFGVELPKAEAAAPAAAADAQEVPAREEGESDEDYGQRLTEAGLDPAEHIQPAESEEDRAARLQQQEGEDDEAYEARLEEEGLTRDDVPAPAAAPTEEEKKAAAQKAREEADLKKLPEPARKVAQAIIDKRIGQITAKAKAKEEEFSTKIGELENQLAEAKQAAEGKPAQATVVGSVHPLLLDPSEDAIAKYVQGVEDFEDWASEHEDGYEPTEAELAKGFKAVPKAEIRSRLRALQRERDKLVPQARDLLAKRATAEAEARKILPAFFDAKTPEYQAARTLLREQPELKRFPDHMVRAAEIILGRKALAELRQKATPAPKKPATPPAKAPRLPGSGSAAKGGVIERAPVRPSSSEAMKRAVNQPGDRGALQSAVAALGF